jgi:superfamily II DNA or RNA helicase
VTTAGLRVYQREAVAAVLAALVTHRGVLFVAPTGSGKTTIFTAIAEARRPHGRILVLAHREELLRQAAARIGEHTALSVGVEMAEARAGLDADVVVASVQTLSRPARLARFAPDAVGLVVVDEAHHAVASTYRRVLDHFTAAKVVGCTATPDRLDRVALGKVFEVAAFCYELRDAIEDGWLVPIRQVQVVLDGLDLSRVRTTAGDLNEGDLERVVTQDGVLHGIAQPVAKHAGTRPTLVFAVTVAHARALGEVLGFYAGPGRVAALSGDDDREHRRETLAAFLAGEVQYLVNCELFTEGVDLPPTSCVAMARPTKSRALYAQMIGRGTRLHPGKTDLLVLDFAGNAGRHALVSTFDVLSGARDAEVEQRAQALMNARPDLDILGALAEAEVAVATERRRAIQLGVHTRLVEVDPFAVLGVHASPGRWGGAPITAKQVAVLERAGIPIAGLDRRQASAIISELHRRMGAGLCTFRQARVLLRYGYDPEVGFEEAGRLLDALAAHGWRRPVAVGR